MSIFNEDYPIKRSMNRKYQEINDTQKELYLMIENMTKATTLAWFKILIDKETDYKTMRELIDKQVEYLDLESLEYYIQIKNKMVGDMK